MGSVLRDLCTVHEMVAIIGPVRMGVLFKATSCISVNGRSHHVLC